MTIKELLTRSRSYRRFRQNKTVPESVLEELLQLALLSPSGGNHQPLAYFVSANENTNNIIFPFLAWAGYLKDWPGPVPGEQPAAYIVICCDTSIQNSPGVDHGIAAQSILIGAAEKGIGGCMIGSFKKNDLRTALGIPERYAPLLVLALGYPAEEVILTSPGPDGSVKYYRDAEGRHHVPKRKLADCIIRI